MSMTMLCFKDYTMFHHLNPGAYHHDPLNTAIYPSIRFETNKQPRTALYAHPLATQIR